MSGSNTLLATITTADNLVDQDSVTINDNLPPIAEAGAPQSARTGDAVALDGRASSDPESATLTWHWSLPTRPVGSLSILHDNTTVGPWFIPDTSGSYVARLIVNDGVQDSQPDNVTITVTHPNTPPTAVAGTGMSVNTGIRVTLDGSGSYDADGNPLTYIWNYIAIPQGSVASLDNATTAHPSFVPDLDGAYIASLTVNDGLVNSAPDNVQITAITPNAPPTAYAGPDQTTVRKGAIIHFDGTGSLDPEHHPLLYAWSVVSRPAGSTSNLDNAASPTPALLADKAGDYVVRLVVNDGVQDSPPDTVVATAGNDPPIAVASVSASNVPINTMLTVDGSASYDPNGDPISYAWTVVSVPTGSTATIVSPTSAISVFAPDKAGSYLLHLIVNDGNLSSAPASVGIIAYIQTVPVPDVGGMSQANAQTALQNVGLIAGTITPLSSDNVASGNVLSQSPIAGATVFQGTLVNLTISSGPLMTTVPNVIGMTQASAQEAITAADLSIGSVTNGNSSTVAVGCVMRQSPAAGAGVVHGTADNLVISQGPAMVSVPVLLGMTQSEAQSALAAAPLALGTITNNYSDTVAPGRIISQNPKSGTTIIQDSLVGFVLSLGPEPVVIPPDPATVAPPLPNSAVTTVAAASQFLYTGQNPIQTGVASGVIVPKSAAVLHGKVLGENGQPLSGAVVTILSRPEFGRTVSRADGAYDLVVNGGGQLVVCFNKAGFLPAQRAVTPTWQTYEFLLDVLLVTLDSQVTAIDTSLPIPMQPALGSVVADERGTRQVAILFPQGTHAQAAFPDGSMRPLASMSIRATEYTVGPNGQNRMPASLPPTTGYTYAVELSVDEAVAMGAEHVVFDQPVSFYIENFLGFRVGARVPVGVYDKAKGYWIPEPDGQIVKILSITDGYANIDLDGDGISDNVSVLSAFGINEAERSRLATMYTPGTSLWRVSMTHFSTSDLNNGVACATEGGCQRPNVPTGEPAPPGDCPKQPGSIISCPSQELGELFPVSGTPFSLNYSSGRVPGRVTYSTLDIPLVGSDVPTGLLSIDLRITIGGVLYEDRYSYKMNNITPNMIKHFVWDGKDGAGRRLAGVQKAKIELYYFYETFYREPPWYELNGLIGTLNSFNMVGGVATDVRGPDLSLIQSWETSIKLPDVLTRGFGGWTISDHHEYDPVGRVINMGNGRNLTAQDRNLVIDTFIGSGVGGDGVPAKEAGVSEPASLTKGPDGSVYFIDKGSRRIRKIDPQGVIHTVAGNGGTDNDVDGIPATQATVAFAYELAVGSDNSIYFSEPWKNRVRRIRPEDGIITTYAGTGEDGYFYSDIGDGKAATLAKLSSPQGLAAGWGDGSLYIADSSTGRVRRVSPDHIISTVAGGGVTEPGTQAISAQSASIAPDFVAIGPDGSVYVSAETQSKIFRITPANQIVSIAGTGYYGPYGEGIPAIQSELRSPTRLAVNPADGSVYFNEGATNRIRRIGSDGILTTVAGDGLGLANYKSGLMARQVTLGMPLGILSEPDGTLYIANGDFGWGHDALYRVQSSMPGLSGTDYLIASEDGSELYVFNDQGRHQRTLDARTGLAFRQFEYDSSALLTRILDADNNATIIHREVPGNIAIEAPGGQQTLLVLDENGYVQEVRKPSGDRMRLTHREDGLLEHLVDWRGYDHWFDFEASTGRLVLDQDPAMGTTAKTLARSVLADGSAVVDFKSPLNRVSRYGFEPPGAGPTRNMTSASAKDLVSAVTISNSGITPTLGPGMTRNTSVNPSGTRTISLIDDQNIETRNDTTGMVTEVQQQPDPRFGMQAPYAKRITTSTPLGLVNTVTITKTATPITSTDISALLSESETVKINDRPYSMSYDNSTRQIVSTSPENRISVATLDSKGRIASAQADSRLLPTFRHYDDKGRLDRTGQDNLFWNFGYDTSNRLARMTSPMGDNTVYGYDNADRVNSVQLPSGRTYGFEFDAAGNRNKIVMPNHVEHLLDYSPVNLDNSYTPPGNPSYTHWYSLDREWNQTILPSGRTVTATYDNVTAKLLSVDYPEAAITYVSPDNDDRVYSVTRTGIGGTQTIAYGYDGFLTTRRGFSGASNGEYSYVYDNNFSLVRVALDNTWNLLSQDNDGLLTGFGPFTISHGGPAGSIDNVSDFLSRTCALDINEEPALCQAGGMSQSYGYDNVGRLNRRTSTVNGAVSYEELLERDPVGRISRKTEKIGANTPVLFEYFYDLDGQLDNVVRAGVLYEKYAYDLNGNRIMAHRAPLWQDGASFDNQDRETGGSVTFDADGNLVHRGNRNYTYSTRGELLAVFDNTSGATLVSYTYDGMNRRVARTDANNKITQYLYGNPGQQFQVTATRDSNNVLTTYFYDDFGALYALERGGVRYYVASDHLGTPIMVTDNAGTVRDTMTYDSYGVRISGGTAFELPVGFAGGLIDNATNLVRFGFRDYEPETGRWASKDPIFHAGGLKLYQYVSNDPVNYRDLSGLYSNNWTKFLTASSFIVNRISIAVPELKPVGIGLSIANGVYSKQLRDDGKMSQGEYDAVVASETANVIGTLIGTGGADAGEGIKLATQAVEAVINIGVTTYNGINLAKDGANTVCPVKKTK